MEWSPDSGPDPSQAPDLPEFVRLFGELRVWAGSPSYRTLAKKAGPLLHPPRDLSHMTLANAFQPGRRRLDLDLVVATVRALGLDEAAVDGWRKACVRVHAEAKTGGPAGVFRQLPAELATFTGREAELAAVLGLVQEADGPDRSAEGARTVVVSAIEGMAGVGKTQLAVRAGHELVRAGRFADAQLYVNLHGFDPEQPPADPSAVLDAFLRALSVPAAQIPAALDERAAMFRDRLQDKQALIVLDNATDERQVRDLIPAAPSCLVLITSRRGLAGLDGARLLALDVFDHDESLALLTTVVGSERVLAEMDAARELVTLTGGLPLAVALVAARLRGRPAWKLAEAAEALREQGLDGVRVGSRSLRPLIDLSFEGLSEAATDVMRAIGMHPLADYTVPAVAAASGLAPAQAEAAMEELVFENLARERVSGRFEVHDLIRAYCAELAAQDDGPGSRASLERLAAWYMLSAANAAVTIGSKGLPELAAADVTPQEFTSYDSALAWLEVERANLGVLHELATRSGLYDVIWQLPIVQDYFSTLRYLHTESLAAHLVAVDAARARGDDAVVARQLLAKGTRLTMLGRWSEAGGALSEALERCRSIGDETGETWALIDLGLLHDKEGRHDEAISVWQQGLAIAVRINDRRRAMSCHINIAMARYNQGRLETSLSLFQRALADARELGEMRPQAVVLGNLGEVYLALGRPDEAYAAYTEQHRLARSIGLRNDIAEGLQGLGHALRAMGRLDEAREHWREALAIRREMGSPAAAAIEKLLAETDSP